MLPGPDQIIACPHCKGLTKYFTLISGNTFGARVWTDGKQVAPMLPRPPAVVKCHHCGKFYWLTDARKIGTVGQFPEQGGKINPTWLAAQEVKELTESEYYSALAGKLAKDQRQEKLLRILAWWRGNDVFRNAPRPLGDAVVAVSSAFRENLKALVILLDDQNENDRIMKTEILRELGEFESVKEILRSVTSGEFDAVVSQLLSLCESKDSCVRELQFKN